MVVTLAEARRNVLADRRAIELGCDPRGGRIPTSDQAAEKVIALHAADWKPGGKAEAQWRLSLTVYTIGLPVAPSSVRFKPSIVVIEL